MDAGIYEPARFRKRNRSGTAETECSPNTWGWLCREYFLFSEDFKALDDRTRRVRRSILERTFAEPVTKNSELLYKDYPLSKMTRKSVTVLRDRKAEMPEAANSLLKAVRQVFKFAVDVEDSRTRKPRAPVNVAKDVEYIRTKSKGFHSWSEQEVAQFEARHPIGSKPRLAMALLLLTGQRRSDIVTFGPHPNGDPSITFIPFKGRNSENSKPRKIPILPALQRIIGATPCGSLTFLVNERGEPYSAEVFGNTFRRWCDQAGLSGCSAHGLRKAGASRAAENGATTHQLMAMFGWTSIKMAELYTRDANQVRIAASGMHFLDHGPTETPSGTEDEFDEEFQVDKITMVPRGGIEPPTLRFSVACSTN